MTLFGTISSGFATSLPRTKHTPSARSNRFRTWETGRTGRVRKAGGKPQPLFYKTRKNRSINRLVEANKHERAVDVGSTPPHQNKMKRIKRVSTPIYSYGCPLATLMGWLFCRPACFSVGICFAVTRVLISYIAISSHANASPDLPWTGEVCLPTASEGLPQEKTHGHVSDQYCFFTTSAEFPCKRRPSSGHFKKYPLPEQEGRKGGGQKRAVWGLSFVSGCLAPFAPWSPLRFKGTPKTDLFLMPKSQKGPCLRLRHPQTKGWSLRSFFPHRAPGELETRVNPP